MARVTLDLGGLRSLHSRLPARVEEGIQVTAQSTAAHTQANIRRHGLIDTGFMVNSVAAERRGPRRWVVGVGADYAVYHEFGSSRNPSRPFFRPAVDRGRQLLGAIFGKALKS